MYVLEAAGSHSSHRILNDSANHSLLSTLFFLGLLSMGLWEWTLVIRYFSGLGAPQSVSMPINIK